METLLILVLGIVAIAAVTALAPRFGVAGPLILVAVGVIVSLLPFVPQVTIPPEWILMGVLPPLLYSTAVSLPALEFRRDFAVIGGLSVGLVVVSSLALGLLFSLALPGLGWGMGIALGAILSPTDAVATSIVRKLGLSPRVVTVLEGESLLNDATALVLLRTAIAGVGIAVAFSFWDAIGAFAWAVLLALVFGAIVGWVNLRVRAWIGSPTINTALRFTIPFIAYIPTEALGGSGLVAAVVAGISTGQGATRWFTPQQRISDALNWRTIELVLEGAVFLVMGLQLKSLLVQNAADHEGLSPALWLSGSALLVVMLVRAVYVSILVWLQGRSARGAVRERERWEQLAGRLGTLAERRAEESETPRRKKKKRARMLPAMQRRTTRALADLDYFEQLPLGWREGVIICWAGMRGVVTLAAAQTLPLDTDARPLLVLVAFLVAAGSLVIQGGTLPWVARRLGLVGEAKGHPPAAEMERLHIELAEAAASALTDAARTLDPVRFTPEVIERVRQRIVRPDNDDTAAAAQQVFALRLQMIEAQRRHILSRRHEGRYSTAALRKALEALDADQISLELRMEHED